MMKKTVWRRKRPRSALLITDSNANLEVHESISAKGSKLSEGRFRQASVEIYTRIKQMIIDWELKPNEQLVEQVLAKRFSASRTPIREALQRLAQDGFVKILPRRGARVSQLSINDIQDIFQIREALEGMAARIAASNLSDTDLKNMMSYVLKCRDNPERDEGARNS